MKKRKMPPHIVLPNGQWRFIKSKVKKPKATKKPTFAEIAKMKITKKMKVNYFKRGISMARRKKFRRSGSKGGSLSRGFLYSPKGIIASALIGAGAATLAEKVVPNIIPFQGEVIGFAVGGVGGAAGAFARNALKTGTSTGSGIANYNY